MLAENFVSVTQWFFGVWDLVLARIRLDRNHGNVIFLMGKIDFHISKNMGLIICVRFHTKIKILMILVKNRHLGRSVQFYASLLTLPSTTPSSETNKSIINFAFVTILNDTIIYMTITLILAIKNSHCIIYCRETVCWTKTSWL